MTVTSAGERSLAARLCFPRGWRVFAGHFPGQPLVPGVFLVDAARTALAERCGPLRLAAVHDARFRAPVGPDEEVECLATYEQADGQVMADVEIRAATGHVAAFRLVLVRAAD